MLCTAYASSSSKKARISNHAGPSAAADTFIDGYQGSIVWQKAVVVLTLVAVQNMVDIKKANFVATESRSMTPRL